MTAARAEASPEGVRANNRRLTERGFPKCHPTTHSVRQNALMDLRDTIDAELSRAQGGARVAVVHEVIVIRCRQPVDNLCKSAAREQRVLRDAIDGELARA
jgi:hypothetical protein